MSVSLVKAWTREELATLLAPLLTIGAAFDIALPDSGNIRRITYNGGDVVIRWSNGGVGQLNTESLLDDAVVPA